MVPPRSPADRTKVSPGNRGEGRYDVGHEHASKKETTPSCIVVVSKDFFPAIHRDADDARAVLEMVHKDEN
jgi:hypothetical protein